MYIATLPFITSASAGVAPLYGMCTTSTPAIDLNNSADNCTELPFPSSTQPPLSRRNVSISQRNRTLAVAIAISRRRLRPEELVVQP